MTRDRGREAEEPPPPALLAFSRVPIGFIVTDGKVDGKGLIHFHLLQSDGQHCRGLAGIVLVTTHCASL